MDERRRVTCSRCFGDFVEGFFRRRDRTMNSWSKPRHSVCKRCEQNTRDARKNERRAPMKATWAIATHARRLDIPRTELVERYGWKVEQMAHDLEHSHTNGCPYCRVPFKRMKGGDLQEITLDIIDPEQPPYYGTNTRWVCRTCNTAKSRMTPPVWGEHLEMNRLWEANQRSGWRPTLFNAEEFRL